jgi:hypothetical protein
MSKLHKTIQKYNIPRHIKEIKKINTKFNQYDTYINNTLRNSIEKINMIFEIRRSLLNEKNYIRDTSKQINETLDYFESELIIYMTDNEFKVLLQKHNKLMLDISLKMNEFDIIHDKANSILNPK